MKGIADAGLLSYIVVPGSVSYGQKTSISSGKIKPSRDSKEEFDWEGEDRLVNGKRNTDLVLLGDAFLHEGLELGSLDAEHRRVELLSLLVHRFRADLLMQADSILREVTSAHVARYQIVPVYNQTFINSNNDINSEDCDSR